MTTAMLFLLIAAGTPQAEGARPAPSTTPAPKMEFESYQLVLLRRPEHPREYPKEKLDEIQREHLGHLRRMAEEGKCVVAGPFDDQPDPRLRGLALYRVSGVEEARKLAEEDPAVKAGRLEVVVMTWYTQKGALTFPVADEMRRGKR